MKGSRLVLLLLLLSPALAQWGNWGKPEKPQGSAPQVSSPQASSPGETVRSLPEVPAEAKDKVPVDKATFFRLLSRAKKVEAFLPSLEDKELAEALWRRGTKGQSLYLLFPIEDISNPLSHSNTFWVGGLLWKDTWVRHARFQETGYKAIFFLDGEVYLLEETPIEVYRLQGETARYRRWWEEAWLKGKHYDVLRYAWELFTEVKRQKLEPVGR